MKRYLALGLAAAVILLMAACNTTDSPLELQSSTVTYTGQGMTSEGPETEKCGPDTDLGQDKDFVVGEDGGYLKWVLTVNDATYAKLVGPWGTFDMISTPGGGAWHKATDYYPLSDLVPGKVHAEHDGTGNVQLVVSNGCPGNGTVIEDILDVAKTAETSFTRTYNWTIEKTSDAGGTVLLYYPDGEAEITYSVTVSLDEDTPYTDSDFTVKGAITITNLTDDPVTITGVTDDLGVAGFEDVSVSCVDEDDNPVSFSPDGYELAGGATLTCTYEVTDDGLEGQEGINTVAVSVEGFDDPFEAMAPWSFDDADIEELDKCVGVTDTHQITEANEDGVLGVVCVEGTEDAEEAPHTFEYTLTFHYDDFDECGLRQVENTATATPEDSGEEGAISDTHTVTFNVQCFQGETAWAANGDVPGSLRYTQRGNWATYVKYEGVEKTTTMFAGQTIAVGTVHFSAPANGWVTITVTLTGDWTFEDVAENLKVQDYNKAPSGNPSPGLFAHKKTCDPDESTCSITVPQNKFYGVHANVGLLYFVEEP